MKSNDYYIMADELVIESIAFIITRLPSNPRPTTRECVHLVTHGHSRSRDKDGGHTIRSAVAENLILHANITAVCSTEAELLPMEVLHCGKAPNRHFRPVWLL